MLNGATLTGYGQTFTVTTTSDGSPEHFTAPNSTIQIRTLTVCSPVVVKVVVLRNDQAVKVPLFVRSQA
jgi:hypothetical protein